jgi:hypothetical protein
MTRVWIVLALLLALFVGADLALARLERGSRAADPRIEKLVPEALAPGEKFAAISLARAGGARELLYVRKKGLWRSREAYGAVCDAAALQEILAGFLQARGVLRAEAREDPARAREYGLDGEDRIAIAFHGPKILEAADRDVFLAFEVGRSFAQGPNGRCFVRRRGSERILEIDRDPCRMLRGTTDGLPPLVDTHLLAGSTSERFRGFSEFRVQRGEGAILRVANSESGWFVEREGRREDALPWRVGGYMGLWLRGRFDAVESPARAAELGLSPPATRITLVPDDGEPIEVQLSAPDPSRRAYVWNRATNVVMVVQADLEPLLAPAPELFLDAARPNPWEAWLRKP